MGLLETIYSWNYVLMVSLTGWLVAQVLKTLVDFVIMKEINWERMVGDGGMPSAHSATVTSLAVAMGRYCGIDSPLFALSAIFAIIVMHDAMGVRRETGEQAKVLNKMLEEWMDILAGQNKNSPLMDMKQLKEMVGHTPLQVVFGAILGVIIGFAIPMV